jgi:hypothetical protein
MPRSATDMHGHSHSTLPRSMESLRHEMAHSLWRSNDVAHVGAAGEQGVTHGCGVLLRVAHGSCRLHPTKAWTTVRSRRCINDDDADRQARIHNGPSSDYSQPPGRPEAV